jgi:protocatechuate 3,4-dioxygenase alpha subunit
MNIEPSASQTVGPFFHLGCIDGHSVSCLASDKAKGEHIQLTFRVLDGEGQPVNDAMIEIWQADAQGKYNHPADWQDKIADSHCRGFGRLAIDVNGTCIFETIKPGRVPGNGSTLQAPHLEVSVLARGLLNRLVTRVYFEGDLANAEDPILALVPESRRWTLMAKTLMEKTDLKNSQRWVFDIHLCGTDETVFFDV